MIKILHISKYYYPFRGGTEQIALDCVNALKPKYEQMVICFSDNKKDKKDQVDDINVVRAGVEKTIASQGLSTSYERLLKETIASFRPDVIIFHYPNPFVAHYLMKYIQTNCKLVIYWHLDIVKQKILKWFFIGQNKRLIKRADVLIATSPNYIEGSPWLRRVKHKVVVIPNCINEKRLIISENVKKHAAIIRNENQGKIICLAVGRHTKYKGFMYLIKAAHLLDDRFQVYIIGKGEETRKLKKEAENDRKIHFLGLVEDEVLKAYMFAMDIFCFPSITKNEAFGLALAEGMYFGKPAVTFSIPGSGVNYVCVDGETGIEVENRNYIKYALAIRKLAEDKEMARKMGSAGKIRVEDNFLNKHFSTKVSLLIERLLNDNYQNGTTLKF